MKLGKDMHVEALIDAHFALRTSVQEETAFRAHMSGCDRCRGHYERCLTVENLSPGSRGPKQRMRSALSLPMPVLPKVRWAWATGALGAAAAAGVALWVGMQPAQPFSRTVPDTSTGFAERGTNDSAGALSVFQVVQGDKLQPLAPNAKVPTNAELSLSYRVADQAAYVMVFAVDAANQIHWYVPAWKNADDAPAAKPVQGGQSYVMNEGVAHPLSAGNLQMVAVFLKRAANVKQIEAAWAAGGVAHFDPAAKVLVHRLTAKARDEM